MTLALRDGRLSAKADAVLYRLAQNLYLSAEQLDALVQPHSSHGQWRYLQRLLKQLAEERYINVLSFREQMKYWPRGGGRKSYIYGIGDIGAPYLSDLGEEITVGLPGYRRKQTNHRLTNLPHRMGSNHFYVACVRNATSLDNLTFEWESEDEWPSERLYSLVKSATGTIIEIPIKPDGHAKFTTRTDEERERHFFTEYDRHTETKHSKTHGLNTKTLTQKFRGYLEILRNKGICYARRDETVMKDGKPVLDEAGQIQKEKVWQSRKIDFGFTVLVITQTEARRDALRKVAYRYCRNPREASSFWFTTEADYYNRNAPLVYYDRGKKALTRQMDYQNLTKPLWLSALPSNDRYALIEATSQK